MVLPIPLSKKAELEKIISLAERLFCAIMLLETDAVR